MIIIFEFNDPKKFKSKFSLNDTTIYANVFIPSNEFANKMEIIRNNISIIFYLVKFQFIRNLSFCIYYFEEWNLKIYLDG